MTTLAPPTPDAIWHALSSVPDPEIPVVSITDMGMVREVTVDEGRVTVTFTPTFSGCPALHVIKGSIEQAVRDLGVAEVEVRSTLTPPWTTDWINDTARERLREYGIAPPAPAEHGLIQLDVEPTRCPRCASMNVRMTASFGPTPWPHSISLRASCNGFLSLHLCHEWFG